MNSQQPAIFLCVRLCVLIAAGFVLGCSQQEVVEPEPNTPPTAGEIQPNNPKKKPGPPDNVAALAPPELQTQFYHVSFAWMNGPGNWDYMTREERSQALLGSDGGLTRNQYNGNTVRVKEVYYDEKNIKNRWQEELRNGAWIRHGPEVFYHQSGRYEILFRIDGELEGTRTTYAADGSIKSEQNYKAGLLEGTTTIYFADGSVQSEENYKAGIRVE